MTTGMIKKRIAKQYTVISLIINILFILFGIFSYLLIGHDEQTKDRISLLTTQINNNASEQVKIESVISDNKIIKDQYEKMAQKYIVDIAAKKKDIETIFQSMKEKYSFISAISTEIVPHSNYINAAKISLMISGKPMPTAEMQQKVNYATAQLIYKFIESLKEEFHVYQGSLQLENNTNIITFIYKK